MAQDYNGSTELDREFDIIDEVKITLDDIDHALENSETSDLAEKVSYLRFLVNDLDDTLSGEYEDLRRKRLIVKKTR